MTDPSATGETRIDRWLCAVRLVKTRPLASRLCEGGHVLVNGSPAKPSTKTAPRLIRPTVTLCYCDPVKNITVSIPDEVYRLARIRAAERGRSVSAIVTDYLRSLSGGGAEFARLEAQQQRIQLEIKRFAAAHRMERDEIHDRAIR